MFAAAYSLGAGAAGLASSLVSAVASSVSYVTESEPIKINEAEVFWYENLTAEQEAAHDTLRGSLAGVDIPPHLDTRHCLLRFLKARSWDVDNAREMFTKMLEWRQSVGVEDIYANFDFAEKDRVLQVYPHFFHGVDKFGRPVHYELLGRADPWKLVELTSTERFVKHHIQEQERFQRDVLPATRSPSGRPLVNSVIIIDLAGLSVKNFTPTAQALLQEFAKVDQSNYPEQLGQMFIINAPLVFQTLSGWVFALLEQRTRSKIHVLGSDYLAQLSALIPVDNIPAFLGGKSACSAVDAALLDAAAAAQPAAADTEGNADQQGT